MLLKEFYFLLTRGCAEFFEFIIKWNMRQNEFSDDNLALSLKKKSKKKKKALMMHDSIKIRKNGVEKEVRINHEENKF